MLPWAIIQHSKSASEEEQVFIRPMSEFGTQFSLTSPLPFLAWATMFISTCPICPMGYIFIPTIAANPVLNSVDWSHQQRFMPSGMITMQRPMMSGWDRLKTSPSGKCRCSMFLSRIGTILIMAILTGLAAGIIFPSVMWISSCSMDEPIAPIRMTRIRPCSDLFKKPGCWISSRKRRGLSK